jgi:DNA-directed RNA polymerase specialized sigma24 family protein
VTDPELSDSELLAHWPAILRESRRALTRAGAYGIAWDPEGVACEVAYDLVSNPEYRRPSGGLIAQIAKGKATDHVRAMTHERKGGPSRPRMVTLEKPMLDIRAPEPAISNHAPDLLSRALRIATRQERRVVLAMLKHDESYCATAKRLGMGRTAVGVHLHNLRRKCRALISL